MLVVVAHAGREPGERVEGRVLGEVVVHDVHEHAGVEPSSVHVVLEVHDVVRARDANVARQVARAPPLAPVGVALVGSVQEEVC